MESKLEVKKGAWSHEEDLILRRYIEEYGEGKWYQVPVKTGLNRTRKSCRLRWLNYLRPDIKHGDFKEDEIDLIMRLHKLLGNKWSLIAGRLPGRTGNSVKNYWNTYLIKKPEFQLPKPRCHEVIRPHAQSFKGKGISHRLFVSDQLPTQHDHGVITLREDNTANWCNELLHKVNLEQGLCNANVKNGPAENSFAWDITMTEAENNIFLDDSSIHWDDLLDFKAMDMWQI